MATTVATNILEEDLIFGYDTGFDVTGNTVASRSYPGEPTVNYATDTPTGGGWSGSSTVIDSATKTIKFSVTNFNANPGAGWRAFTWDMTSHSGSDVTISCDFDYVGPVGDMAWVMIGQGNTYTNNSGAGGYLGYSPTSDRTQKNTITKEHISWSGTIGSGGGANQPSGHIGITVWINNGVPSGTDSYIVLSNIQIEKKSHVTPFVNGTRSVTASLIDLKKSINVDLTNASFDSTGQPTFDGTDDKFNIKSGGLSGYPTLTFETVVRFNGSLDANDRKVFHWDRTGTTNGIAQIRKGINNGRLMYQHHNGTQWYTLAVDDVIEQDKFVHIVVVHQSTTATMYKNSVSIGNSTVGLLNYTNSGEILIANRDGNEFWKGNIPIFKVYDRTLTAAEIKDNYNAYKNRFNI